MKRKKTKSDRNIFQEIRKKIHKNVDKADTAVNIYEIIMILLISLIAVTIAWFTYFRKLSLDGLKLQSASDDKFIEISYTETPFTPVNEKSRFTILQDASKDGFYPGASGEFTIYVRAKFADITKYQITFNDIIINGNASTSGADNQAEFDELRKIVNNHIRFYTGKTDDTDANSFDVSKRIEASSCITDGGTASEINSLKGVDVVVPVKIFWTWPYDYSEIPGATDLDNNDKITSYDSDDRKIGLKVEQLKYEFNIKGLKNAD